MIAPTEASIEQAVLDHCAAWNERDKAKRAELLAKCLTNDVHITVAGRHVHGREGMEAEIVGFHSGMPNGVARLSSLVDAHGNVSRYAAVIEGTPDGVPLEFLDACEHSDDGRIRRILTFVGAAPKASK